MNESITHKTEQGEEVKEEGLVEGEEGGMKERRHVMLVHHCKPCTPYTIHTTGSTVTDRLPPPLHKLNHHPSPSSLIPYSSFLIPHSSSSFLIPCPSFFIPHSSSLIHHPYTSFLTLSSLLVCFLQEIIRHFLHCAPLKVLIEYLFKQSVFPRIFTEQLFVLGRLHPVYRRGHVVKKRLLHHR